MTIIKTIIIPAGGHRPLSQEPSIDPYSIKTHIILVADENAAAVFLYVVNPVTFCRLFDVFVTVVLT